MCSLWNYQIAKINWYICLPQESDENKLILLMQDINHSIIINLTIANHETEELHRILGVVSACLQGRDARMNIIQRIWRVAGRPVGILFSIQLNRKSTLNHSGHTARQLPRVFPWGETSNQTPDQMELWVKETWSNNTASKEFYLCVENKKHT